MIHDCLRHFLISLLFLFLLTTQAYLASANDPIALNNYGLDLVHQGEFDKGLEQLQRAYFLFPTNGILKKNLAEAYTFVGKRLADQRRYDEAADKFDMARELFPDNVTYGLLRGIAFHSAKRYDAAIYEFERIRKAVGDSAEILFHIGKVNYDQGNLQDALDVWDKALQLDPGNQAIAALAVKVRREVEVEAKMDRGYSSRFSITYDADTRSVLAGTILDTLENAYNKISADLEHFPVTRTQVILYTKKDYRAITAGPDWSGGLYDGKVRLPVGGAPELTPMLRAVLYHEYTHAVIHELAGNNVPFWLNEGMAEYEGRTQLNTPMSSLGRAVKSGTLFSFAALEAPFTGMNSEQASLAYQQSYAMVNFIIASYGWPKIKQMLLNLGSGMTVTDAVAKALSDFGLDYAAFEREWLTYMSREFGPDSQRLKGH